MITLTVNKSEEGMTLEKFTRKVLSDAPISFIYKLFRKKDVRINNHWEKEKAIVYEGDVITIYVTDSQMEEFSHKKQVSASNELEGMIVYEDENILIVNKPRGLLVQKDHTNARALDEMVSSYLTYKGESSSLASSSGPAHRLDRNTGGLVIFGKNSPTLAYLFKIINEKNNISKHYVTLVKGEVESDGFVDIPLKKDTKNSMVFVSDLASGGKCARTNYHIIKKYKGFTLLDVILETGRTHQIRVHMAYIKHPVVGDNKYGDFELNHEIEKKYGFVNQFLIANRIDFGELEGNLSSLNKRHIEVDMPNECKDLLSKLD